MDNIVRKFWKNRIEEQIIKYENVIIIYFDR